MRQHGFPHLWNYIDDLLYTGLPSQIYPAYQFLLNLLPQLGFDISQEKLVPPATAVTCLGSPLSLYESSWCQKDLVSR